jgi:hypothetical protein
MCDLIAAADRDEDDDMDGGSEEILVSCPPCSLDLDIASALTGVLAVYRLNSKLPMTIMPELAGAIKSGVVLSPVLAASAARPAVATLRAAEDAVRSLVSGALGVDVSEVDSNPMEDLARGLLSLDSTLVAPRLMDLQKWVADNTKNVLGAAAAMTEAAKMLPTCLYKCCSDVTSINTDVKAPSLVCPLGFKLDALTMTCAGSDASFGSCPAGMNKCNGRINGRNVCVAQKRVWGMDSCTVLNAMDVANKSIPMIACP